MGGDTTWQLRPPTQQGILKGYVNICMARLWGAGIQGMSIRTAHRSAQVLSQPLGETVTVTGCWTCSASSLDRKELKRKESGKGTGPPLDSSDCPKGVGRELAVIEAPAQARSRKGRKDSVNSN